jgi:hypothetical protein
MQKLVLRSSFTFKDINACKAFRVKTIQITGNFVLDKVELQFYHLTLDKHIWIPLEIVVQTASYPCMLALRLLMEANPDLSRVALSELNSIWDCMYSLAPYPIPSKKETTTLVTNPTPLYQMFRYVSC